MTTSIYLSNNTIQILTGEKGKCSKVEHLYCFDLEEGNLMNGVITNENGLQQELLGLWKEHNLPVSKVSLVIDSTHFTTRLATLPVLKEQKMRELLKREFSDMDSLQDPLYDYMPLEENRGAKMGKVMCAAAERSFVGSFVELFERMGISIISVKPALCSAVLLLGAHEALAESTCIILLLDGDNLVSALLVGGKYVYSSRARLFSEHGTPEFAVEVARNVSGIMQFHTSEKLENVITHVYLGGFFGTDARLSAENIAGLGLAVERVPETKRIQMPSEREVYVETKMGSPALCDYVYAAGNFIL
ncbi:hypothetical protein GKG47_05460 [Lactonifactor sp. BIOML-A3]|uniref:type IV pilus biogenesis protein PilM n=1 Tax=unclassified Lactonifactor TaxID=2636670 RepID=UPI0012AF3145|nr:MULTISPECIES: hypothetical protein [unclassified Lactonifactor]MSA00903.1 hypothetical protein [Lactonifactor sp. BIOML-A5]MSA07697.1 hypothetical protein [Lactonifactor sp. BIOML-A4]MSA11893.1 hypothetical protein [Lactonifactor sp. BIOML-A3]MSA16333.1 hypothetical protein [Lactonifactor sp. BIOML-A2]MSA36937.1 hypothetical protein [Lactonifactor sp. BIOML-A1]